MDVVRRYLLTAGLPLLLTVVVGCGAPQPTILSVSPTPSSSSTSNPTAELTPFPATSLPAEPTTPPPELKTPTASATEMATPGGSATSVAPEETVASHPLPLDEPWVHAGYRLLAPGGAELELQDTPTSMPPMGLEVAPDGSWATYAENEPGSIGLVLRNLRDGSETRIPGQVFRATFSPDSRAVVYSVIGQNGWSLLAKALPDGEPRVITERTTGHLLGPLAWTEDGILAEEIIWASDAPPQGLVLVDPEDGTSSVIRGDNYLQARSTRDGAHIAFVAGVQMIGAPGEAGILVQDRATGTGQQIVPQHAGMISSLGWSPDASQLFYVPATFAENTIVVDDIHIITADGTNDRPLSIAEAEIQGIFRDAAWRDDDTLLVLTADAGGTVRLYEIAATDLTVAETRSWESAITGLGDPIRFVRMPQP